MNVLISDPQQQAARLDAVVAGFNKPSIRSASELRTRAVNAFLDGILQQQAYLKEATADLQAAETGVRTLLFFADVSPAVLARLQSLIDTMFRTHGVLLKNYVAISRTFTASKIGKADLLLFKAALDDLKELADDLNDRFFVLAQDDEFQALMGELNGLVA